MFSEMFVYALRYAHKVKELTDTEYQHSNVQPFTILFHGLHLSALRNASPETTRFDDGIDLQSHGQGDHCDADGVYAASAVTTQDHHC